MTPLTPDELRAAYLLTSKDAWSWVRVARLISRPWRQIQREVREYAERAEQARKLREIRA